MKIVIAAVSAALMLSMGVGTLLAQTYEWTDAGGVIHFTDNPEMVPRKYKATVRVRESVRSAEEETGTPPKQPAPAPAPEPPKGETMYGGKPFPWWQAQYQGLASERQKEVARLDELKLKETAVKRKKLILQRASDRAAVREVADQIAGQEGRIKAIDVRIEELEGEALRAGVPPRWKEIPAP